MSTRSYPMACPEQGRALVFVNDKFYSGTHLENRNGAERDMANYNETFEKCGLEVDLHENKTKMETKSILQQFAVDPARESECMMVIAFSTHGDQMELPDSDKTEVWADALYCTDGLLRLSSITMLFTDSNCKGMAGKPKLFFIQACRGVNLDATVEKDGAGQWQQMTMATQKNTASTVEIPIFKDFHVAYSTPPGYLSLRAPKTGSWFVKCLHDVIVKSKDNVNNYDLMSLMTLVRKKVAVSDDACRVEMPPVDEPYLKNRKLTPWTLSMLTKEVWFKQREEA